MAKKLTQEEYTSAMAMVKRGKEVTVAGRKVTSLDELNAAMEHEDEYVAQVEQIEAGQMVRLSGRTALSLDELHFALNAKPAGPIEFVPAGVPMILGFGEQADANALQATIDEQNGTILALQGEKQGLETEKQALASELQLTKDHFATEIARSDAAEASVKALTTERDAQAETIAELRQKIEAMEQAAALMAMAAEKAAAPQSSPSETAPGAPVAATAPLAIAGTASATVKE